MITAAGFHLANVGDDFVLHLKTMRLLQTLLISVSLEAKEGILVCDVYVIILSQLAI